MLVHRRNVMKAALGVAGGGALGACIPNEVRGQHSTLTADQFHSARRFAQTHLGRIAFVEQGSGSAAVFLHGWPLNGFHWRGAMARLARYRRCIAPDFMGLGYSEVPDNRDLSPASQAEMIAVLLDELQIGSADFIANDSGTAVAQLLVARHPTRVRTMLLTNGDVHTNSPPAALEPAIEAARKGLLAAIIGRHLTDPHFASSPQGLGGICYTDPANLTYEAMSVYFTPLLASPVRRAQFQQYGVAFEPNPLPQIAPSLRVSAVPVRMLWGTGDIHFPVEWAEWLDRTLPLSRGVRLVEGAKLFFTEERSEIVAEEALSLWRTSV